MDSTLSSLTLKPRALGKLRSNKTFRDSISPIGLIRKTLPIWFWKSNLLIEMTYMELIYQDSPNFGVLKHPIYDLHKCYKHSQ